MSKKKGNKSIIDGIEFASDIETAFYLHLKKKKEEGLVKDIRTHVTYILIPSYTDFEGNEVQAMTYTSDFNVIMSDGSEIVIDTKEYPGEEDYIKRKLFMSLNPDTPFYWVERTPKYLGFYFVRDGFISKLRRRYEKLHGSSPSTKRNIKWTSRQIEEHFEFEDNGLFLTWKKTKRMKKGVKKK
ncbi:DUF1064 domain-containing protein [Virgibacillus sp. SK37]|uniref:DUF1064 domain-containing protein n=1 Tax=Virgibacillus sp. SK37 TaxID=403957 RepID=UPI0004D1595E|nr:DUF1064 domain-containing protein [Virgibacillus sp. SK37]AIF45664.1 hypothetical protein X953_18925 [Virgibacillus sp. SK37]